MIFLMYHELETTGRTLCQDAPGYVRYVVRAADFCAQMQLLKDLGWRGLSVSEALAFPANSVAITFDDGCETDLLTAAPLLRELGFGATFYITAGFLGKSGYLSKQHLRELSSLGFEIGCHSMTHAYLSDLDEKGMHREIIESKQQLEQMIGKQIDHFSCPGGRYNDRSIQMARKGNYRTLATSRARANFKDTDLFALGRLAVMRGTALTDFEAHCRGTGLWRLNLQESLRRSAKQAIGNSLYDRLRGAWLHR